MAGASLGDDKRGRYSLGYSRFRLGYSLGIRESKEGEIGLDKGKGVLYD